MVFKRVYPQEKFLQWFFANVKMCLLFCNTVTHRLINPYYNYALFWPANVPASWPLSVLPGQTFLLPFQRSCFQANVIDSMKTFLRGKHLLLHLLGFSFPETILKNRQHRK